MQALALDDWRLTPRYLWYIFYHHTLTKGITMFIGSNLADHPALCSGGLRAYKGNPMDIRNLSLTEQEALKYSNALAMRPCSPDQQAWHSARCANAAHSPTSEPARRRSEAEVLTAIFVNLEWALDCASLSLNRAKPGYSSWKTQSGIVRGLRQALDLVKSEMGAS